MYRLAKESNIHHSNFSNLKAGRMKEMSWMNMCKIADALEVSLDEFREEQVWLKISEIKNNAFYQFSQWLLLS